MSCAPEDELGLEAAPFAAALGRIFEIPTGLIAPGQIPPVEPWTPTICRLGPGPEGRQRLLALAAAAEHYALLTQR